MKNNINEAFQSNIIRDFSNRFGGLSASNCAAEVTDDMIRDYSITDNYQDVPKSQSDDNILVLRSNNNNWLIIQLDPTKLPDGMQKRLGWGGWSFSKNERDHKRDMSGQYDLSTHRYLDYDKQPKYRYHSKRGAYAPFDSEEYQNMAYWRQQGNFRKAKVAENVERVMNSIVKESIDSYWTEVNTAEDGGEPYMVGMWCGSGYLLDTFKVFANNEEEALYLVVSYLDTHNINSLFLDDWVTRERAEYEQEHPEDETLEGFWEMLDNDDTIMYVDATTDGAESPHWIYAENLRITPWPEELN